MAPTDTSDTTDTDHVEPQQDCVNADTDGSADPSLPAYVNTDGIHPDGVRLDRGHGAGAATETEDWMKANNRSGPHDGRAHTRTTFYPEDVDTIGPGQRARDTTDQRSWGDLATWNDGAHSDRNDRKKRNKEADYRRWLEAFVGQLDATDLQHDRAQWLLDRIDRTAHARGANVKSEVVLLAVLTLSMDVDVTVESGRTLARDDVDALIEDINSSKSDVFRCRRWIKDAYGERVDAMFANG